MRVWLLVVASCVSASALGASRRCVITAAGLGAVPWKPRSSNAADIIADEDCEDCRIPSTASASQKFEVGDVISLDDNTLFDVQRKSATDLFDAERRPAATLPNPQLEAKKAMYKMAAGEYDVGATQVKLSTMIQTTPVLIFSLSS